MLWTLPGPGTNQMTGILSDKNFFVVKKRCLSLFSYFTNYYATWIYIKF